MFCSFQFYLYLTSPFKPCCEVKNSLATTQEGRLRRLKRLLTDKLKQKNAIEAKSLTSLSSLPFAACIEIAYMICNRLNKFSSLAF